MRIGREVAVGKEIANEIRYFVYVLERQMLACYADDLCSLATTVQRTLRNHDHVDFMNALTQTAEKVLSLTEGDVAGYALQETARGCRELRAHFDKTFGKRRDEKGKLIWDHTILWVSEHALQDAEGAEDKEHKKDFIQREKMTDLKSIEKQVKKEWLKRIDRTTQIIRELSEDERSETEERGEQLEMRAVRKYVQEGQQWSWGWRNGSVVSYDDETGQYGIKWIDGLLKSTITKETWLSVKCILLDPPAKIEVEEVELTDDDKLEMVMRKYFDSYDLDGSGLIDSRDEMTQVCTHIMYQTQTKITTEIQKRLDDAPAEMAYDDFQLFFLRKFPEVRFRA